MEKEHHMYIKFVDELSRIKSLTQNLLHVGLLV